MKIISLGAGVQSSCLLLMAHEGEIEGVDAAVFADTGWEPKAVYDHLEWLKATVSIPIHVVSAGNIRENILNSKNGDRAASMPYHLKNEDNTKGFMGRQCSQEYKLNPVRRWIQANRNGEVCEVLMGISLDEVQRMRDSDVKYCRNVYPLVDMRMSRNGCLIWMQKHGYKLPPKSACVGCPFHANHQWRDIKDNAPEEWTQAVEFDAAIRRLPRIKGEVYLHPSLKPLDKVDLSTAEDHGQLSMFGNECLGVCGN